MINPTNILQSEIESAPDLPVIPTGISNLLRALTNDDISYAEMATELEKFPSVAIKIVATANSAWASPTTPITTLRDSCSRIGLQLVRSISIALSISQVFVPDRCSGFDPKHYWVSAFLTAEAAHLGAKDMTDVCPDTARLAGLLHNIGLLWLADKKPGETSEAINISKNNKDISLTKALCENYDLKLNAVGGYLAAAMELPDIITSTITNRPDRDEHVSDDTDAIIKNHHHAYQLASVVIHQSGLNDIDTHLEHDNQNFMILTKRLPYIESMAQILFYS